MRAWSCSLRLPKIKAQALGPVKPWKWLWQLGLSLGGLGLKARACTTLLGEGYQYNSWHLHLFGVLKAHQGQGYGQVLFNFAYSKVCCKYCCLCKVDCCSSLIPLFISPDKRKSVFDGRRDYNQPGCKFKTVYPAIQFIICFVPSKWGYIRNWVLNYAPRQKLIVTLEKDNSF